MNYSTIICYLFKHSLLIHTVFILVLGFGGTPTATAAPTCKKGHLGTTDFQRRQSMDRCEGVRRSQLISASGLWLSSFSIGQSNVQRQADGGETLRLWVPISTVYLPHLNVRVQARRGHYLMEPLQFGSAQEGWKTFTWGTAVIRREQIREDQLRATALLRQPGDADQWLPVKFAPANAYNLVIASNAALRVDFVRIVDSNDQLVRECSGPTRLETELPCRWDARDRPAGTYRLIIRSADSGNPLLNVSLRHNPSWLEP